MNKISKNSIVSQIQSLGIVRGDVVFIAADLLRVGYFAKNREQTLKDWVDILFEIVGPEGTIVIPAYTETFLFFKPNLNIVFKSDTKPSAGSLSDAFYFYGNTLRSKHPTNSCFASGPKAEYILNGHDENSFSYLPYHKVIELGGKNLMLGAFKEKKLAPMAMHIAQEKLGYTIRHWLSGLTKTYYIDSQGNRKLFTRKDSGGCTAGAYKTYGHHILENAIIFGDVGNSTSACIDTSKSFNIFIDILKTNPSLLRCDDKTCNHCYTSSIYNPHGYISYTIKNVFKFAIKFIRVIFS